MLKQDSILLLRIHILNCLCAGLTQPQRTFRRLYTTHALYFSIPTASLVPGRRQGQQSPPFSIPSLATQLGQNLQLGLPFRTAVVSASEISLILSTITMCLSQCIL